MATRFYIDSTNAPSLSPTYTATWDDQSFGIRRKANDTTPGGSAMTTKQDTYPSSDTNGLVVQLTSRPVTAQTLSGTLTGVISVAGPASSGTYAIIVKVMASNGTTVRGTMLAITQCVEGGAGTKTTLHTITFNSALSSVSASAGDVIVFELGWQIGGGGLMLSRLGDSAGSDFALTANLATDLNPWLEISSSVTFQAATGVPNSLMMMGIGI